jgi:uncharacterized cupredoxin-like copper-binding protein
MTQKHFWPHQLAQWLNTVLIGMLSFLVAWAVPTSGAMALPLQRHVFPPISAPTLAVLAPSQLPPGTVNVHLGTAAGELKFEPNQLVFTAGQRYKLVLDNPSDQKHYFTAKDFADAIWSQKVDVAGVEVKGAIHELELKPGATADWVFVPQKPGTYELHCSIAGHAEAGMVGTITVLEPA